MSEERKIKFLTAELHEADEIINKLENNYKKEKQKSDELTKKCTEYSLRIGELNKIVIDIENCSYDKDIEIENLKEMINDATGENKKIQNDLDSMNEYKQKLKMKIQELEKEFAEINISLDEKIKENAVLEQNYLELTNRAPINVSSESKEISLFDEITTEKQLEIENKNLKEINCINRKHIIFMRVLNLTYISIIIYLLVEYYKLHF